MPEPDTRRIAVVGSGPAAFYAVDHLLESRFFEIEVDLFERLPHPWGLLRTGVAADHPDKKGIIDRNFAHLLRDERVRFFGATEVGTHVSAEELLQWYDAVIYAVGADDEARLGIPGEDLPGSVGARTFVGWYNGDLDTSDLRVDLTHPRAVIVGNGNVALDVARMLLSPMDRLEHTDLADHALAALRQSRIEEVVILGRRGAEHAAFNNPELEEFLEIPAIDVIVDPAELVRAAAAIAPSPAVNVQRKLATLAQLAGRPQRGGRRLEFRFRTSPFSIVGDGHAEAIVLRDGSRDRMEAADAEVLEAGLVIRACGYRRMPFPGLPFDPEPGVIANQGGRVVAGGEIVTGAYVTGWAKRGCKGIIGSNRKCAGETVEVLLSDMVAGKLAQRSFDSAEVEAAVRSRNPMLVVRSGWNRIDRTERDAGRSQGRPRVKVTDWRAMLQLAGASPQA